MKKEESAKFLKLCLADALLKMMKMQSYDSINVKAVCEQAGVGRTTFYRYFDKKSSKEDLLVFKLVYEWKAYNERHKEEVAKDGTMEMLRFVYENRNLFRLMYKNGLVTAIMKVFDDINDWTEEKNTAYLRAFFVYGYFGVVYQWIKYDFDETPEQIQKHTVEVILHAMQEKQNEA